MGRAARLTRRQWLQGAAVGAASIATGYPPRRVGGAQAAASSPRFELSFDSAAREQPFTGRVYVFLSRTEAEPRQGAKWINTEPFLAKDVVDLRPGDAVSLSATDPDVLTFPRDFASLLLAGYRAQGMMRFNPLEPTVPTGAGNGVGPAVDVAAGAKGLTRLTVNQVLPSTPVPESKWSRPFEVSSRLLEQFLHRPTSVRGMVTLPASWHDDSRRRYPVIYQVPGFGGTLRAGFRGDPTPERNGRGVEFLRVMLDPVCPLGHHVFADSANNGPWGQALIEEFLPAFDAEFRTVAEPRGRLLTGHSSGGWSTLWVQTRYPETFGGTWSTAPDPVDFRDFQRIDVYREGENAYVDPRGERRPLGRRNGQVMIWFDDFSRMEEVLGPGGQLHSFEAVFSPRNRRGKPMRLWDRETGAIDARTAAAWKPYDIRLRLEENWETLGPQLAGKLHVHMGAEDTFYLDGATRLLQESLARLGSDAVVEIHAGRDHGNLMTQELRNRIEGEMAAAFLGG